MEDTGKFKIEFRHELKTGFMGHTIKDAYVIGQGPLSTRSVADQITYAVVEKVTDDKQSLSEALSELYGDPLPSTDSVPNSCQVTTVDEDGFEDYEEDVEFEVYFYHYRDTSIRKDGCGGFASKIMASRNEYLEMADKIDELHDEECKGFGPDEPADPDTATLDEF